MPTDVLAFLRERVSSVGTLEVRLLLFDDPDRAWTVRAVSVELYRPDAWVDDQLEALVAGGFARRLAGNPPAYRWAVGDPTLTATIGHVEEEFRLRRTRVIGAIYAPSSGTAERFADAFRVRPEEGRND